MRASVTLVPLVSWLTPGNVAEGGLLRPSLHWCRRHLGWWPGIIVVDMGYLSATHKQTVRTGWQCAVVTKQRADMKLVPPYVSATQAQCPQGQRLEWWEYEPATGQQWFRAPAQSELCAHCWEASRCPRHFGYAGGQHETLFGLLPLVSRLAQRLLQQVRPWIEPAQSFEKNQLGLRHTFFNSLRLTWQMSLWVDSAVLLRTMAWLDMPPEDTLLTGLLPVSWNCTYPLKNEPPPHYPFFPAIPHSHQITFGTPSFNQDKLFQNSQLQPVYHQKTGIV